MQSLLPAEEFQLVKDQQLPNPRHPLVRRLADANGGAPGLLALLASPNAATALQAAWALNNIAGTPGAGSHLRTYRPDLAPASATNAGSSEAANAAADAHGELCAALPAIAAALAAHAVETEVCEQILRIFGTLAMFDDCSVRDKVATCTAVLAALVAALCSGSYGAVKTACMAVGGLATLSGARSAAMVAAGVVPPLVALLDRRDAAVLALSALLAIINGDCTNTHRAEAAAAGAVPKVVEVLRWCNDGTTLAIAIRFLGSMAFERDGLRQWVETDGQKVAPRLTDFLRSSKPEVAHAASGAVYYLALRGSGALDLRAFADSQVFAPLIALAQGGAGDAAVDISVLALNQLLAHAGPAFAGGVARCGGKRAIEGALVATAGNEVKEAAARALKALADSSSQGP